MKQQDTNEPHAASCRCDETMHVFYIIITCLLLVLSACKPVPQNTLTLLYTSDTTGQIEHCG